MIKKIISAALAAAVGTAFVPALCVGATDNGPVFSSDFESEKGLTLENGAELADGKDGKGLHLDGADDYAILPKNIVSDKMTISAWVKQDKKNVWGRLFDLGEDSSNNFFFAPCSGGASRIEAKSESGVSTLDSKEFESTGVWAYYTVTADENGFKLYRDGRLIGEKTSGGIKLSELKNTLNYIGKSHYEGDAYFAGTVDDFKIYNRVLTREEIIADMSEHITTDDASEIISAYTSDFRDGQIIFGNSIELPTVKIGELELVWESSDNTVISSEGRVTPADTAREITLSAGIVSDDQDSLTVSSKKDFKVTVPSGKTAPFTVEINASDRSKKISDNMWGLFFEDINSAADGGLYAELVQNGSFEYPEGMYSWTVENGTAEVKTAEAMNENNPTYIEISNGSIVNDGYMGMSVKAGESYNVSVYAKGSGIMTAQLLDDEGNTMGSCALELLKGHEAEGVNPEWTRLEGVMKADKTAESARLRITINGTADIDNASLMPQDTYKGHGLRKDLCEALEEIHPTFLRFPGGCAVEGRTMDLAYNWKDTVGDITERKQTENIWNSGDPDPYIMSYGLGFYEYFQLCEDMGMTPVPILNCGMACQVRSGSSEEDEYLVPMDELQPYIDDAIDLVAFANGTDMSNKWVKLRSDMGHPEPFNLKYLGIGNEQYGNIYFERYEAFAKALRAAYPDMELQLVTTSGTSSSGNMNDLAWSWINAHNEYADVVDEHYYENPDWFRTHAYRYDTYNRDTAKVFLGEYASKGNTWYNALSEAAFMTGLERNADVVRMASYAPIFAKYGNTQWSAADMLWFTNSDFVKTPNYYVQKLFGNNPGDYSLETKAQLTGVEEGGLSGGILLGAWNTQNEYKELKLTASDGTVIYEGDFNDWKNMGGTWTVREDGSVEQTDLAERCALWLDGDYSDYTLEVKARKTGGSEGFQIGVAGRDHKNYYRINMGGWSNTVTKLQKVTDGTAELVSNVAEGNLNTEVHVKDNEWQTVKVVVSADTITAYLDGELACQYTMPQSYNTVYASSVYDDDTGETIVKLVNTADAELKINIKLNNAGYVEPEAAVTVMSAESSAVNTLENKDNVVPREGKISNAANDFEYAAEARSLNIIKLKTRKVSLIEHGSAEFYDEKGTRHIMKLDYNENGVLVNVGIE